MSSIASSSHNDSESRGLEVLLEAFGFRFSLEDIAAAYSQSNRNVATTGEVLSAMIEKTSDNHEAKATSGDVDREEKHEEDEKTKASKPKKYCASLGSVSRVIGKEYVRTKPLTNGHSETTKPVKIDSRDIPESEIWSVEMPENTKANTEKMRSDIEEFLLKMLGEGFQVDQDVVHDLLGSCGYYVQKMPEKHGSSSRLNMDPQGSIGSDAARTITNSQGEDKDKGKLQREILEALFSSSVNVEEDKASVIKPVGERRRGRGFGVPVSKPLVLEEPAYERIIVKQPSKASIQDEDDFEALRKSASEYWNAMKEYYKAAVEAILKGERERAYKLLEEGHFFRQKALEADEKSTAKLVRSEEEMNTAYNEEEVVTLNLQNHEPKDAIRALKHHLTYMSNIPSFKYLRIIVGANEEGIKSSRKRLMVKLLEKESIVWSEESNGLIMMIQVDEIDPKSLSFSKKSRP